jgi:hypothetical protein
MSLFVRIVNNQVVDCWDTPPAEGVGNNGWKNAVEVRPTIMPNRQGYTAHTFDLTKDPVEIVYGTFDISVDDRKAGMKANAAFTFQQVVNEQARNGSAYDANAVATALTAMQTREAAIDACTTHDQLDALN